MNKRYEIPAIVLGMTVNGLGVVRSLARNGITVYALDSYKDRPGMNTRYAKCLVCPDVQKNAEEFKDFLLNLVKKIGAIAVLLPTSDAHNEFVNNNREDLMPYFKFAMSAKPIMDQLLNKKGQYVLAKKFNIPIPETYFPQNIEDVENLAKCLKYPVILKGLSTGNWRKKFGDKKAVIVNNAKELLDAYNSIHNLDHIEPIIQEIILGDDTRHYKICAYIDRNGNPLLTFTLQKIRQYPCDFGIGSSVVSVWEPEIAELGLKFMQGVGYWGVGSIEFKKDTRDDKFKMIEINPRLWAQNSLPDTCGQNFSLTAYLDILGERLEPKTKFKEGIKWIAFDEDRTSFKGYHKQGIMSWGHWLNSIMTGKRIWGTWAWDDPMPFLKAIKFGLLPLEKIFIKIKRKTAIKPSYSSEKIESNISLQVIKDFESFLRLRQEWNTLLGKSNLNNPFLRHEWLSAWWRGYGRDKELNVICFKKDKEIIGFAPLMKYKTKLIGIPIEAIGFIANHWVGLDFIFSKDTDARVCIGKLQDYLVKKDKITIFSYFKQESKVPSLLYNLLNERKAKVKITQKSAPYIHIQGPWEAYLKERPHYFRADYIRKKRMMERTGKLELIRLVNNFDIGNLIKELKEVSLHSWQGEKGVAILSSGEGVSFYQNIMEEWLNNKFIDINLLRLNNRTIAYFIGFNFNGNFYQFDTAYDERFSKFSPGMVIHNMLLERLFSEGPKIFDFGYYADYKKRWTNKAGVISDLTIFPENLLGTTLCLVNKAKERFRKLCTTHNARLTT